MQLRSEKASSPLVLAIEFDDKLNNFRKAFRKVFACLRILKVGIEIYVFLLLGKMINTSAVSKSRLSNPSPSHHLKVWVRESE